MFSKILKLNCMCARTRILLYFYKSFKDFLDVSINKNMYRNK